MRRRSGWAGSKGASPPSVIHLRLPRRWRSIHTQGRTVEIHPMNALLAARRIAGFVVPFLFLATCEGAPPTQEATPLVDAAWLEEHLDQVVVLDVRTDAAQGAETYALGHIPGAVYAAYGDHPWRVAREGIPGMLPPVDDLQRLVGSFGIGNEDYVVIVPGEASVSEFGAATRIYWQFKVLGHDAVSILDGGYAAWEAAGYPVEYEANVPEPATFTAHVRPELVANREDVLAALERGTPLVDGRPEAFYLGNRRSGVTARAGTIAGARNVPGDKLFSARRFAEREAVEAAWREAGLPTQGDQITFCNTGHMASMSWFASYAILGNKEVRLYDASLAEWAADAQLPMDHVPEAVAEPAIR